MTTSPQLPHYRLIAVDLDGTLVGSDCSVSSRNRQAIAQAKARGVIITLVTGRTFLAVQPITQTLQLTAPVIIYNGAAIRQPRDGKTLLHRPLPAILTQQIIGYLRRHGFSPVAFVDSALYSDQPIPASIAPHSGLEGMTIHVLGDNIERCDLAPEKIAVLVPERNAASLAKKLCARWDGKISLSHPYPSLLEMTYRTSSKGRALCWLAERLNIPRACVMAVGDGDNDIDMLQWAGLGVAMGNAPHAIRAVSNYVADSVEADGLAQVIERFVLSER